MKKLTLTILVAVAVGVAAVASPKSASSLASCLWHLVGGAIETDVSPSGATALAVNVDGVKQFQVLTNGGLFLGRNSPAWWVDAPDADIVAYRNTDNGDADNFTAWFAAEGTNGEYVTRSEVGIYGSKSDANILVARPDAGSYVSISTGNPQFQAATGLNQSLLFDRGHFWISETISTGGDPWDHWNASWKLGSVVPATVTLVTDKYVQVEIGGQIVKLAVVE